MRKEYKRCLVIWVCLMILLALTWSSSFVNLGAWHGLAWNGVVNLAIALAKALLVALFFMELLQARALLRVVAVVALFTLALLFSVSSPDYATRTVYRAPWQTPAVLSGQ